MINITLHEPEEKRAWWGDGPWCNEPDHVQFEHAGLKCHVYRMSCKENDGHVFGGHLCGYVVLPDDHLFLDAPDYDGIDVDVHGGLTYYDKTTFSEGKYCLGFDCAHHLDSVPSMEHLKTMLPEMLKWEKLFPTHPQFQSTYKTIDFVIEECKKLAEQIAAEKGVRSAV